MVMNNLGKRINNVIGKKGYNFWLLLFSIICLFILFFIGVPKNYALLYFEPVVYIVGLLFFIQNKMLIGLGSKLLIALYFIKLCVIPITTVIGDFTTPISYDIYYPHWNEACLYIALEWIIIAFSIRTLSLKYLNKLEQEGSHLKAVTEIKSNHLFFTSVTVILMTICIFLLVTSNYLRYEFYWIWTEDSTGIVSSIGGAKYYIFKTFVEIVRPLFLLGFVIYINSSRLKHGKVVLTILVALLAGVVMTEYRILALLTSVTIVVYILAKNIDKSILLAIVKVAVGVLGVLAVFWLVTGGDSLNKTLGNLCRVLDNYCGGYMVTAGACSVHMKNGFEMFFHDIASGSYLIKSIIRDLVTTTDVINQALNPGAIGSFYELIVQCKDFFGIFMPVAIYLVVKFVVYMDYRAMVEKDELYSLLYLFCAIGTAVTILMYTYSMVVNFIVFKCLIWIIIIWIDKHWRGRYIIL